MTSDMLVIGMIRSVLYAVAGLSVWLARDRGEPFHYVLAGVAVGLAVHVANIEATTL